MSVKKLERKKAVRAIKRALSVLYLGWFDLRLMGLIREAGRWPHSGRELDYFIAIHKSYNG